MKIIRTKLFDSIFQTELELNTFIEAFISWKSSNDEYNTYIFGKDCEFITPKIDFAKLKHVNIVPCSLIV